MLALLVLLAGPPPPPPAHRPIAVVRPVAAPDSTDLKRLLRERLEASDAHETGIFHEDVTADLAPLFPPGQSFEETRRTIQAQGLGELTQFKGEPHEGTTMYVSRYPLETKMFGDVYLVLDFDFDGTSERDLRLKRMTAFLRASNM